MSFKFAVFHTALPVVKLTWGPFFKAYSGPVDTTHSMPFEFIIGSGYSCGRRECIRGCCNTRPAAFLTCCCSACFFCRRIAEVGLFLNHSRATSMIGFRCWASAWSLYWSYCAHSHNSSCSILLFMATAPMLSWFVDSNHAADAPLITIRSAHQGSRFLVRSGSTQCTP